MNIKVISIWILLPILCFAASSWHIQSYPQGHFSILMTQKQGPIFSYKHKPSEALYIILVDRFEQPKKMLRLKLVLPFQFFLFQWITLNNITLQMNYTHHSNQSHTSENHNYFSRKQINVTFKFHSLIIISTNEGNLIMNLDGQGLNNIIQYKNIVLTLGKAQKIKYYPTTSPFQKEKQLERKKFTFYLIFSGLIIFIYLTSFANSNIYSRNQFFRLSIETIYLFNEFFFFNQIWMAKTLSTFLLVVVCITKLIILFIIVVHESCLISQSKNIDMRNQFIIRYIVIFLIPFIDNQAIISLALVVSLHDTYQMLSREYVSYEFRLKTHLHTLVVVGSFLLYQKMFGLQGFNFIYKQCLYDLSFHQIYIIIGVQTIIICELKYLSMAFFRKCKWIVSKNIKNLYSIMKGKPIVEDQICRICYRLNLKGISESKIRGKCGHQFHRNCLGKNIPKTCPIDDTEL